MSIDMNIAHWVSKEIERCIECMLIEHKMGIKKTTFHIPSVPFLELIIVYQYLSARSKDVELHLPTDIKNQLTVIFNVTDTDSIIIASLPAKKFVPNINKLNLN